MRKVWKVLSYRDLILMKQDLAGFFLVRNS